MRHLVKKWNGDDLACGQMSLAMVADSELNDVVKAVGHLQGVSVKELREAATRLGFDVEYLYENGIPSLGGRGIVIVHDETESMGHAMAWEDGVIYDPDGGMFTNIMEVVKYFGRHNWGITHLMRIVPVKTREWSVGK